MLGLAVATKVTPALVLPASMRRRPAAVIMSAMSAVIIVYLPHVIAVGRAALGYLPGYLQEEGYRSGSRFALLTWLVPDPVVTAVAVGLLGAICVIAARSTRHDEPWQSAALVVGSALILTSPTYTWYAVLLVVLVGLGARWEWLAVPALGYIAQYADVLGLNVPLTQRLAYGTSLVVVCVGYLLRRHTGAAVRT
jgi:hypothetical protein